MIQFSNVSKRYPGGHDALRTLTFTLKRGSMNFLTGHSGAGKSTLLKLIVLSERATRGEVIVDGTNISRLPTSKIPAHRRKIGTVFQDHKLLFDRSVLDNVALPLIVAGIDPKKITKRVHSALRMVSLLDKKDAAPITLSGGQQQRVGVARAFVNRPDILLADEPTGNLDPQMSDDIMDLFYNLNALGTTVLVATHDTRYLEDPTARKLALQDGRLVEDIAASELLDDD